MTDFDDWDEWESEAGNVQVDHDLERLAGRLGAALQHRFDEVDECLERMEAQNVGLGGRIDAVDRRIAKLVSWTEKTDARVERTETIYGLLSDFSEDTGNEFGELEGWRDSIDLWRDSVDVRLDQVDARFDQIDEWRVAVDRWRGQVDMWRCDVDTRFDKIDVRLDTLESKVDALDVKIDKVASTLDSKIDLVASALGSKMDKVLAAVGAGTGASGAV